jgi:muramidase (phage lysozyme)
LDQLQLQNLRVKAAQDQYQSDLSGGTGGTAGPDLSTGPLTGGGKAVSSMTADATLPPQARALLDTISGPESSGAYNIRYTPGGGATFDSYASHPGIYERGPQGPSSAAGRYQIVKSTFDPLAKQYGYADFSPVTQDQAAWKLAQNTYQQNTGRDLLSDLQAGRTQDVGRALASQWGTLARAMPNYAANLAKYANAGTGPTDLTSGLAPVPNFAGRMAGAEGAPYTGSAMGIPSQPGAPAFSTPVPSGYGVPSARDVASARYRVELDSALGRTPNPNDVQVAGFPTTIGLDFAKAAGAKQLEIAGAGPITAAQERAKFPFGSTNITYQAPDGSLREGPVPNTVFADIARQSFPALAAGIPGGAPTPIAGTNFASNLPRLPGQPQVTAPAASAQPSFDPNVWAARNKTPIGLVNGQLAPIDARGNPIANAPGWGQPNVPASAPQTPQTTGYAAPATPGAAATPAVPQGGYQLGKPILNPTNEFNPSGYDFSPKIGQGPGQDRPLVIPSTPDHPYSTEIPPLSSQAPLRFSGAVAGDLQKKWIDTSQKLYDAQAGIQSSKQLLGAMADIFKNYESGAFATYQSALLAKLNSLGIPTPNGVNRPEDAQKILKDNFQTALQTMKATGIGRFTQLELKLASENFANPDLKPAANFAILTQDYGKILQAEALAKDWAVANQNGWSDPNSFATQWYGRKANDLSTFVNRAKVLVGPFKGMTPQDVQQMIPQTATGPNGQKLMLQGGKWVGL